MMVYFDIRIHIASSPFHRLLYVFLEGDEYFQENNNLYKAHYNSGSKKHLLRYEKIRLSDVKKKWNDYPKSESHVKFVDIKLLN